MSVSSPFPAADNTPITPGSGQIVRCDNVDGVMFQVVKLDVGAPGTTSQVTGAVPVNVTGDISIGQPGQPTPNDAVAIGGTDGTKLRVLSTSSTGVLNVSVQGTTTVSGSGTFNVLDQGHVNNAASIYASQVRSASPTPITQTNSYVKGLTLFLNITQAPTTVNETLTPEIMAIDPGSGNPFVITNFTGTPASNSGTFSTFPVQFIYQLYPGVTSPTGLSLMQTQSGILPYQYQIWMTHSGTHNWTYSLGASFQT